MQMLRLAAIGFAFSSGIFAQQPLEFEVASVKPAGAIQVGSVALGVHIDGAQVTCNYFSLRDFIRLAYRVKDYQIIAPEWMASERFNLAAKIPAGVPATKVPEMMRTLLEDRFQLKFHHDRKEFAVYGLTAPKGAGKLKESVVEAGAAPKDTVDVSAGGSEKGTNVSLGNGSSFAFGSGKLDAKKVTMIVFADLLARFVDKPVVDMTGLTGNYDILIDISPEDFRAMQIRAAIVAGVQLPPQVQQLAAASIGDSLHIGMEALGLKLEQKKAPLETLVVDSANKAPSEN